MVPFLFIDTLPLMTTSVMAGFPSPADDYVDEELNIHELLVEHPAATFFMRVNGNDLAHAHIVDGDIIVVDRSRTPRRNDIVVTAIDGELIVEEYRNHTSDDAIGWGVVCGVIRKLK